MSGDSRKDAEATFTAMMNERRYADYRKALVARGFTGERLESAMVQAITLDVLS